MDKKIFTFLRLRFLSPDLSQLEHVVWPPTARQQNAILWRIAGGPLVAHCCVLAGIVAVLQMLITTTEEDLAQDENETLKKKDKDKKYHWNHGS